MTDDSPRADILRADDIEALAFADLYAAAPEPLRQQLGLCVAQHGGATLLLAPGLPTALFNRVIGLGQQRPADESDLDALRAAYRALQIGIWWLHWGPCDAPAGFVDRLLAQGFTAPARRSWAKVMRSSAPAPQIATSLLVEPATAATLEATTAAIAQSFGMPPFMATWMAALHGRAGWRIYTVKDAATPVGGGCLFIAGDCAWLGMGGVLESHRRRGGQGALMAHRIADAQDEGCTRVFTETGEPIGDEANPSLANMARCGFRVVASRLNFEAPRG